ncbi:MAG TPA: hypothetical protein VKP69_02710 [Isosphaeraceae bacterium]|nr:hypothetical protein [Isosphaeraceae bacterium]
MPTSVKRAPGGSAATALRTESAGARVTDDPRQQNRRRHERQVLEPLGIAGIVGRAGSRRALDPRLIERRVDRKG